MQNFSRYLQQSQLIIKLLIEAYKKEIIEDRITNVGCLQAIFAADDVLMCQIFDLISDMCGSAFIISQLESLVVNHNYDEDFEEEEPTGYRKSIESGMGLYFYEPDDD